MNAYVHGNSGTLPGTDSCMTGAEAGEELVAELLGCSVVEGVVAAGSGEDMGTGSGAGIVITDGGSGTTATGSTTGISSGTDSGG